MRSQPSFRLGVAPSLFAQTATSAAGPVELQVTVKFIPVPQSEVCRPYKPGHNECPVAAKTAESLKDTYCVSRAYPLSAGKSVGLPLEPKFHTALISGIDAGNYAVVLEFDWKIPLVAVVDMVLDSSKQLSESSNSHHQFDRSQASPYALGAPVRASAGTMMRVGPLWYTHQKAKDFEPDRDVKWKLIINDTWYGFHVKPAT